VEFDLSYGQRLAELGLQARIAWAAAGVSLILLVLFVLRARSRLAVAKTRAPAVGALHRCDSATASIEFLLVLFPFLFIVMTVWQLAFMYNARLHVGYAAFAAARSAAVVIPAEIGNEKTGDLFKGSDGEKWTKIRRAALPGTLAVSPGDAAAAGGTALAASIGGRRIPPLSALAAEPRYITLSAHYMRADILAGTRLGRAMVKNAYAAQMTQVFVNGQDERVAQTLAQAETVSVTVSYAFALQVPYVGRMLEAAFRGLINPISGNPIDTRNPFPSMEMSETITLPLWYRKRTIEPGGS
jgi:hypothetical protein